MKGVPACGHSAPRPGTTDSQGPARAPWLLRALSRRVLAPGSKGLQVYPGIPSREHLQNGYGCRILPSGGVGGGQEGPLCYLHAVPGTDGVHKSDKHSGMNTFMGPSPRTQKAPLCPFVVSIPRKSPFLRPLSQQASFICP